MKRLQKTDCSALKNHPFKFNLNCLIVCRLFFQIEKRGLCLRVSSDLPIVLMISVHFQQHEVIW